MIKIERPRFRYYLYLAAYEGIFVADMRSEGFMPASAKKWSTTRPWASEARFEVQTREDSSDSFAGFSNEKAARLCT